MQYYLDGFKPGDPTDSREFDESAIVPPLVDLPGSVDVLIVGCGPAGLLLASQLSRFPDISTRIIERKSGPLKMGQADGISGRSIEIFQSFGFADRILKEAYYLEAITFWTHDAKRPDHIIRTTKKIDGRSVFSEFPHVVLNQARVHQFFLDTMQKSPAQLVPDYHRRLVDMQIDPSDAESPVSRDYRADGSRARGSEGGRLRSLCRRLRRCAEYCAAATESRDARRLGQQGLGRHGSPAGLRLPGYPHQEHHPVGERRQRADHSARRRSPGSLLCRDGLAQGKRARVEPGDYSRATHRGGQPDSSSLHDRRKRGGLVVGLRDRPAI